jgi:hypothetical protein
MNRGGGVGCGFRWGGPDLRGLAVGLLAWLAVSTVCNAQDFAVIRNRILDATPGEQTDVAVIVVAVDGTSVTDTPAEVVVPVGTRSIEVACMIRVFAGMGKVGLETRAVLLVQIDGGRSYRLDARVSSQGDCIPQLE